MAVLMIRQRDSAACPATQDKGAAIPQAVCLPKRVMLASVLIGLLLAWEAPANAQAPEYQVKAAMLYNFALFVDWPKQVFPSPESPFVICVLGENPFEAWLRHELSGMRVSDHPVQVRLLETAEQAGECALVFISRSEQNRLAQVLGQLRGASVLTISDIEDFCRQGGMIDLFMEGSKVRFNINAAAAEESGLKISSRLLQVAHGVNCSQVR